MFGEFLKKNKGVIGMFFVIVFLFGVFYPVSVVNAIDPAVQEQRQNKEDGDKTAEQIRQEQAEAENSSIARCVLNPGQCMLEGILSFIYKWASLALWISGTILNFTIFFTITMASEFIRTNVGISAAWVIIRDFVNLIFIFGLLYIAISTIIKGWESGTKKLLGNIIVAALLINFSYFFVTVGIDVSNVITLEFHKAMGSCAGNYDKTPTGNILNAINSLDGGVSDCFMQGLKLQTLNNFGNESLESNPFQGTNLLISMGMTAIFIVIASMIFFAAAVLLLIRFVTLIFLLITSPFMFLGMILPKTKGIADKWLKQLSDQLIFAPLMFLFMFVSLKIILDGNLTGFLGVEGDNFIDVFTGGVTAALGVIINYCVVIGFMIGSLVLAKQYSGAIGGKAADWATKKAGGAMFGGAAMLGRNTIGRAANSLADTSMVRNLAANKRWGMAGRTLQRGLKRTAKSSFDTRKTWAVGGVASALGAAAGGSIELGKAQEGGYKKILDDRTKDLEKEYKEIGELSNQERVSLLHFNEDMAKNLKDKEKAQKALKDLTEEETYLDNAVATGVASAAETARLAVVKGEIGTQRVNLTTANQNISTINADPNYNNLKNISENRQKSYVEYTQNNRGGFRSAAADREFLLQLRERQARRETDTDKIVAALKSTPPPATGSTP